MALELARIGRSCELYERAPKLEEAGAGIQLSPNALRVLHRLGLGRKLEAAGTLARAVTLRAARSGRTLATVPVFSDDGTPYLSIHRADLQAVLLDAVEACGVARLLLGHTLVGAEANGAAVRLSFDTSKNDAHLQPATGHAGRQVTVDASLVMGADGVRSALASLLNAGPVRSARTLAWRGTVALDAAETPDMPSGGIEAWLGPRSHAIAYPIAGGHRTNLVLIEPETGLQRSSSHAGENPEDIAGRFAGWDPRLRAMIAATRQMTPWPLLEVPRERAWRYLGDRALLIGDAAHAMLPYAAQGAAMAIEDAAVLANRLSTEPDQARALAAYEAERRPRIEKVRRRVAFHRRVYHMPPPFSLVRDQVLASSPPQALRRGLSWLYDWSPD